MHLKQNIQLLKYIINKKTKLALNAWLHKIIMFKPGDS